MTSAEYPASIWVPAHPSNYRASNRKPSEIEVIALHITDGHADPHGTADMFATPKGKRDPPVASSAHFVVGQSGLIIQCVLLQDIAYHAHGANGRSLAIEHCARTRGEWGSHDIGLPITPVQFTASARLSAWLLFRCGMLPTRATLQGHAELDPATSHEDCPTGCLDLEEYAAAVAVEYARLQSATLVF